MKEQDGVVDGEATVGEDPHPYERVAGAQLVGHECREQRQADARCIPRWPDPPSPRCSTAGGRAREPHAARDQNCTAEVERRGMTIVGRLGARRQHERDDGHGDVDPEDGPPVDRSQVAPGQRADGCETAGHGEEDRHGLAALADGERAHHDRQRGGEHEGGERTLHNPPGDDPRLGQVTGGGGTTERRGGGEADHADHDHAAVPGHVGEPSAEGKQGGQGQQIAVHHPLHSGRRKREVFLQLGNGDRDDRLVDEGHRDREDHRHENEPLVGRLGHGRRSIAGTRGRSSPPDPDLVGLLFQEHTQQKAHPAPIRPPIRRQPLELRATRRRVESVGQGHCARQARLARGQNVGRAGATHQDQLRGEGADAGQSLEPFERLVGRQRPQRVRVEHALLRGLRERPQVAGLAGRQPAQALQPLQAGRIGEGELPVAVDIDLMAQLGGHPLLDPRRLRRSAPAGRSAPRRRPRRARRSRPA